MDIDFTEIPAGNKGGKDQDTFELFACDFLESLGYEIVERPSRGPDGKKDLIVKFNSAPGITSDSKTRWLVSCKHNAHSNKGVSDTDEPDISDRIQKHNCNGFIGFYSTIPTSSLSDKIHALKDRLLITVYDSKRIEKEIYGLKDKGRILATYFPKSRENWNIENHQKEIEKSKKNDIEVLTKCNCNNENLLEVARTAQIQIDIAKIKYEFDFTWKASIDQLNKLMNYVDFSNELIADQIFNFLQHSISSQARSQMPTTVAWSIHSLILTYFPSSYESHDHDLRMENGKQCVYTGFNLAYDSLIYTNNFRVAQIGLNIMKFIYRESKRKNYKKLMELVMRQYVDLETTLLRPERDDLVPAQELVKLFKEDLEKNSLIFPVLPRELYALVEKSDNNNLK
jgi:hypothetical protein